MKLNNKGFAISTVMYIILIMALVLIVSILGMLSSRKMTLDKVKDATLKEVRHRIKKTAVEVLLKKSNSIDLKTYETGSEASHQMYAFEHPATEQTGALTDYRYIGNDPYNYVDFNGETWRIIGIFTVEDENGNSEQRIKLIKDEKLDEDKIWGSINGWSISSKNEYASNYLNNIYYNKLSDNSKNIIDNIKYYLAGVLGKTGPSIYSDERGKSVYASTRPLNWIGKVGLIYPSDYAYTYAYGIDDKCYNEITDCFAGDGGKPTDGWLFKSEYDYWTMNPEAANMFVVFLISERGFLGTASSTNKKSIRPVVYLKPDVKLLGNHTGSAIDHYQFEIEEE